MRCASRVARLNTVTPCVITDRRTGWTLDPRVPGNVTFKSVKDEMLRLRLYERMSDFSRDGTTVSAAIAGLHNMVHIVPGMNQAPDIRAAIAELV